MKPNKFNAWDNDKNKMAKVVALDWGADDIIISCHLQYADGNVIKKYPMEKYGDDIKFLQCTGIKELRKDNGEVKEIYEGHIVRCYGGEYCQGLYEFNKIIIIKNMIYDCFMRGESEFIEIIGNVYENPELAIVLRSIIKSRF